MTRARLVVTFFAACLALAPLPGASQAGCRSVFVQKSNAVLYQPVYANYAYAVGQQLQNDSQDERIANLVVQKLQAAQLQAPQTLPQSMPDRWSLVRASCVKCHSETNERAIAKLYMGDLDALSCDEKNLMIKRVMDGEMPPNKPLAPEVLGNLIGQIVGAKTAPGYAGEIQPQTQSLEYEVQAEPEVAPEPPKPVLSKWKFAEGDWISSNLAKAKVLERWRIQHLGTGKVTNMYRCEFVNGHVSVVKEEEMSAYAEPESLPAEEVPPPNPEPNQEEVTP